VRSPEQHPASPRRLANCRSMSGHWPSTTDSSRSGRQLARTTSRTAPHSSGRRSPGSKAARTEHLYEHAIHSAHTHGFVHNEALANEVAARFYVARGFKKIAHAYLQDARYAYIRWGVDGKVCQLDELYPHLREEKTVAGDSAAPAIGSTTRQRSVTSIGRTGVTGSGDLIRCRAFQVDKVCGNAFTQRTAIECGERFRRPCTEKRFHGRVQTPPT
jgi:hypothetical protein